MRIDTPGAKLPFTTPQDPKLRDHPVNDYGTSREWNLAGETWEGVLARRSESTFHEDDESRRESVDGQSTSSTLGMASAWVTKYLDVDSGALHDHSQDPKSFWGGTIVELKDTAQPYGLVEDGSMRKMGNGAGSACTRPEIPLDQLRLRPACGSSHVIWDVTQSSDISKDGVPHCQTGLYQVGILLTYKWCVS